MRRKKIKINVIKFDNPVLMNLTIKISHFFLIVFINVIIFFTALKAEPLTLFDKNNRFGVYSHYILNYNDVSFHSLPGVPSCCPMFETGKGNGYALGGLVEYPFWQYLNVSLRLEYKNLKNTLTSEESLIIRLGNDSAKAISEHKIESDISLFGIQPYINFIVLDPLNIFIGLDMSYNLGMKYHQIETLIKPTDKGVFPETGTRTRFDQSGDVQSVKTMQSSIFVGANLQVPVNSERNVFIVPEIVYAYPNASIFDVGHWKISSLHLGLGLQYRYTHKIPDTLHEERKSIKIDTVTVKSKGIAKSYFKKGIEIVRTSEKYESNKIIHFSDVFQTDTIFKLTAPQASIKNFTQLITHETQIITESFPLLPVVFFEKGSSEIQPSYTNSKNFDLSNLSNPIMLHDLCLNVIADRLKKNPGTKINIHAFIDPETEKGNCDLANDRSNNIKKYLIEKFGIEDQRINILKNKSNCSPDIKTYTKSEEGYSENRRVELSSDDYNITEPILANHYSQVKLQPDSIFIQPEAEFPASIENWQITLKAGNSVIDTKNSNSDSKFNKKLIENDPILSEDALKAELIVTDFEKQTAYDSKYIKIQHDTSEFIILRLSLVLFDIRSDQLSEFDKKTIKTFAEQFDPETEILVSGYSDNLGKDNTNLKLSERRAKHTAEYLQKIVPNLNNIKIAGFASNQFPAGISSYQTPVERFLARTVQIQAKKRLRK
ncbi:MAG: OmpA family protein [Candidatus Kapabacteria bacterium]|nr:OmpA family protein [Candidatus Kapabacteria bacterium]